MAEILSQVSQNTPNCALQSLQRPFTKSTFSWGKLLDSPNPFPILFNLIYFHQLTVILRKPLTPENFQEC